MYYQWWYNNKRYILIKTINMYYTEKAEDYQLNYVQPIRDKKKYRQ